MATIEGKLVIGYVLQVNGSATAKNADGSSRLLQVGDPIFANDIIATSDASAILVEFTDGSRLDLGRNATAMLNEDVYNPNLDVDPTETAASVEAIQQAILAGEDPTLVAEATAAGAGTPEGDESVVLPVVERSNLEGRPESGFETTGLEFSFPDGNEELLFIDSDDAGIDNTVIVSLIGPSAVVEGETTSNYTVSIDQLAANVTTPITVNLTYSGVALDGTDFTGVASVVIA
ncbi:retention module-containing protein, partial [Sulfuriflexus sp.]|uniref:retention module-containing protein n=1 Tax=Sulfuriflexus sp. TaxID=2015443 RepID=UPI0028CD4A7F